MSAKVTRLSLIALLIFVSANLLYAFSMPIIDYFFMPTPLMMPAPPSIGVEAGPLKVTITEQTPWSSVAKLLVTILGTFLGIKIINRWIK